MRQLLFLMLLAAGTLRAQEPVAKMYDDQVTLVEHDVLSLAEVMPADKYDFAPTNGSFTGVRTFGEQVKHLATMIYMTSAFVLEEQSPHGPGTHNNGPDKVQSKAQIVAFLKDSIAYARRAMASLTEDNHMTPVASAFGQMPRSAIAELFSEPRYAGARLRERRLSCRPNSFTESSVPTGDEIR